MARPSEDELIARYFAPLAGPGGLGLQDDAALLSPPAGHDLVLTVDTVVAGIHFLPGDPPETIGWKALAVNLSDLAAKGAAPAGFLLALALPDGWSEGWLAAFAGGLSDLARAAGCPLLGGDTVRAGGPLTISVTALGLVPAGGMVRRTTAGPGDLVCVTGTVGDASLGLPLARGDAPGWAAGLAGAEREVLLDRYRKPRPRLPLATALRRHASAAMDVSDGLAGDLAKMCRASGVTATVDLDDIPVSPAARRALTGAPALLERLVAGGDDYEILFTLPEASLAAMRSSAASAGVDMTVIGRIEAGPDMPRFLSGGVVRVLPSWSFQHF